MARIRTIKPDFWTNARVLAISPIARLLFIGMWNFADDYGRMQYEPISIKARVFPIDAFSLDDIRSMLNELCREGLITVYSAKGREYLEVTGWDHQKIDRRQESKLPAPFDDGVVVVEEIRRIPPTSADTQRNTQNSPPVMEGIVVERKREDSDADASDAGASRELDPRKRLFDEGLPMLGRLTGKGPDACRSFVGKCLKEAGDDAIVVLGLIEDAERNRVADPSAWIAGCLKGRKLNGSTQQVSAASSALVERLNAGFGGAAPQEHLGSRADQADARLLSYGRG